MSRLVLESFRLVINDFCVSTLYLQRIIKYNKSLLYLHSCFERLTPYIFFETSVVFLREPSYNIVFFFYII